MGRYNTNRSDSKKRGEGVEKIVDYLVQPIVALAPTQRWNVSSGSENLSLGIREVPGCFASNGLEQQQLMKPRVPSARAGHGNESKEIPRPLLNLPDSLSCSFSLVPRNQIWQLWFEDLDVVGSLSDKTYFHLWVS